MDKKTLQAFLLIGLILMAMPYYYRMIGISPEEEGQTISQNDSLFVEQNNAPQTTNNETIQNTQENTNQRFSKTNVEEKIDIETNLFNAIISSNSGGSIKSFILKDYSLNDSTLVNLVINGLNDKNLVLSYSNFIGENISLDHNWKLINNNYGYNNIKIEQNPLELTFQTSVNNSTVEKKLVFYPNKYFVDIMVNFKSLSNSISQNRVNLMWKGGVPMTEPNPKDEGTFYASNISQGKEISKHNKKKNLFLTGATDWVSTRSKYFTTAIIPKSPSNYGEILSFNDSNTYNQIINSNVNNSKLFIDGNVPIYHTKIGFDSNDFIEATLYLGPLQYDNLKEFNVGLENTMSFGIAPIRGIGRAVLSLLTFLYKYIPNYGMVLIVFSILVKLLVYPLTKKSYQSMKAMTSIQPEVQKLRDKYKNDPQRVSQETLKLYKTHGVNPLGGCLPMLLQMPLLFALFIVFRSTIELRGAPFLFWIDDLSRPDALIDLPFFIPLYGDQISILPLIMGLSMFVQQKMSTVSANPQQKMMTQFMSVFMIVLFNQFPSGLNLYYTLFNILTILQQRFINRDSTPRAGAVPIKN